MLAGIGTAMAVPAIATASPGEDSGSDRPSVSGRHSIGRDAAARGGTQSRPSPGGESSTAHRQVSRRAAAIGRADTVLATSAPPTVPVRGGAADRGAAPSAATTVASTVAAAPTPNAAEPAPTPVATAAAAKAPGPIKAAVVAAQAYIYGYPLMEYQRVRQTVGTVNTLYSLESFANPDLDPIWLSIGGGKRPNVDTFYSLAELDLSNGPVVLSIPDMGSRYFSFQLTDPYTNASAYIGSRTTGSGPGRYAITWVGGPQVDLGPDVQTVLVPYASMLALGRTLAGDAADQQQAIGLMQQYSLDPSGGTVSPIIPIPKPGLGYLDAISAAMELNPPPPIDAPQLAAMAEIGVGPGLRVEDANLSLLSRLAAGLAVQATAALLPLLTTVNQYASALQNRGWATPDAAIGNYGTDYLLRAGVAEVGLLANTPDEAVYSAGLLSRNLLPLGGLGSYVLHFAPGEEPPVGAFWSVTVYDNSGNLVPNAAKQYDVSSSRPDELVRRPDGSIDIIFSPRDPGDPGANWLKTPFVGGFNAYLRMYVPDQSVLDGTWTAPAIVRHR